MYLHVSICICMHLHVSICIYIEMYLYQYVSRIYMYLYVPIWSIIYFYVIQYLSIVSLFPYINTKYIIATRCAGKIGLWLSMYVFLLLLKYFLWMSMSCSIIAYPLNRWSASNHVHLCKNSKTKWTTLTIIPRAPY